MPTINYQKRDNVIFFIPPNDYILEVVDYERKFAKKTGADMIRLKLREIESGVIIYDNLVFTSDAEWKIDTFITAAGLADKPGPVDFSDRFLEHRVKGARCWAKVSDEPGLKDPNQKYNKVVLYYTDKPVPPRASKIHSADVPTTKPAVEEDTQF